MKKCILVALSPLQWLFVLSVVSEVLEFCQVSGLMVHKNSVIREIDMGGGVYFTTCTSTTLLHNTYLEHERGS